MASALGGAPASSAELGHVAVALRSEEHVVEALDHVVVAIVERAHGHVAQCIVERPEERGDAALPPGSCFERLELAFEGRDDHGVELVQLRPGIG